MTSARAFLSLVAVAPLFLLSCASSNEEVDGADGSGSAPGSGGSGDDLSSGGTESGASGGAKGGEDSGGADAGGSPDTGGEDSGGADSTGGAPLGGEGGLSSGGVGDSGGDTGVGGDESSGGADAGGSGGEGSGGNGAGGTDGDELEPYRSCDPDMGTEDNPGCDAGAYCGPGFCVSRCEIDPDSPGGLTGPGTECPLPLTGDSVPHCELAGCALRCTETECPDGMTCGRYDLCAWAE